MKRLLPLALVFLIACSKQSTKPQPKVNGIVNYTIEGDSIQIVDSASQSVAKWIYESTPVKGYAMQAYYAKPGGEVSYMISLFIATDNIQIGGPYTSGVTGSILRNSTDYVSTEGLQGTYINVNIDQQKDQTLTGTFTATLQNLNTNKFVEISGSFDNVKLMQ